MTCGIVAKGEVELHHEYYIITCDQKVFLFQSIFEPDLGTDAER